MTPVQIHFVGEQSGPAEDRLKVGMRRIFMQQQIVRSAFLARISRGAETGCSVALCLRMTTRIDENLNRFRDIFGQLHQGRHFHDILWLDANQEQELRKVCRPFYEAA